MPPVCRKPLQPGFRPWENRQTALRAKKALPLARFVGLLLKGSVSLDSQSPKGSLRIQFPVRQFGVYSIAR